MTYRIYIEDTLNKPSLIKYYFQDRFRFKGETEIPSSSWSQGASSESNEKGKNRNKQKPGGSKAPDEGW